MAGASGRAAQHHANPSEEGAELGHSPANRGQLATWAICGHQLRLTSHLGGVARHRCRRGGWPAETGESGPH